MIKKLLCCILMLCFIPQVNIAVFAAEDTVILNEAFENTWGNAETNGGEFSSPDSKYGMSVCLPTGKYATLGKYISQVAASGRYMISFDFYTDNAGSETFRFVDEKAGNMASRLRTVVNFRTDGYIGIQRVAAPYNDPGEGEYDWPSVQDPELRRKYKENDWNNFRIWLDFDNSEIAYYLNGELIDCIPLDLNIEGIKGFSFCKYENSNGVFYVDNLKMIKENTSHSNGFDPVCIKADAGEEITGNNFYIDNMPGFDITFSNRLSKAEKYSVTYNVQDAEGKSLWTKNEELNLGSGESLVQRLDITAKYFGVMKLIITINNGENSYAETIPYTLSNHTSDMPNNKRSGVQTSCASGRDIHDEAVAVIKGAGIGNARGEDLNWALVEKNGEYALSDLQEKWLDMLSENDIDYLFLLNAGHPDYAAETHVNNLPFSDESGYDALSKYCEELVRLADGRVKYIEVLNEVHAKLSRGYTNELIAKMHKAVYKGVKAGDENVKVLGIDEDSYAYNVHDYISGYLKEMGGEKCFDAVSLHPYPRPQDGAPYYFEGDKAAEQFVNGVRGRLQYYGYDYNTPIIFSEIGWADTNPSMDFKSDYRRQAAYTIRAQGYAWANGLADVMFNFCLSDSIDYIDSSPDQATFGICESYTKSGTEIPYLGKPVYVALAYYNGLLAEAEYVGKEEIGIDNSYCYKFKDRKNRNVMMLGMIPDGAKESVSVSIGEEYAILADMYGNEKLIKTQNGTAEVTLCDEPQYLISCNNRPVAVFEGNVGAGEKIEIKLLKDDGSHENVYYQGETYADEKGHYSISIPIDNNQNPIIAYIGKDSEQTEHIYKIYEKKSYVITLYENAENGMCELTATMKDEEDVVMIVSADNGEALKECEVCRAETLSNGLKRFKSVYSSDKETVKCFFFENAINIIPVDEYTVLKSER